MLKLSEFLEVDEGVEFKIENKDLKVNVYKIENNRLLVKCYSGSWINSIVDLNEIANSKITILPEPILTDAEREYLNAVIKPYHKKGEPLYVYKVHLGSIYYFLSIKKEKTLEADGLIVLDIIEELPFNNLELDKPYELKDLGLEEEK